MSASDSFLFGRGGDTAHLLWKDKEPGKTVYHGPIFDVVSVNRTSPDGREGSFIKVASPEWVTIIPLYRGEDGRLRFLMEQQFRHGSGTVTREFPAGLVEKGEKAEDAALRELKEETGCEAGRLTLIGNVSPNSAFMSNRSNFFLAEDLRRTSGQSLDRNELLDVFSIPVDEAMDALGSGMYDNGIMMIAFGFLVKARPELWWQRYNERKEGRE